MIYMYNGTPGSGKSLHMAEDILHYLNSRKDRLVIANFEIDLSYVKHPERYHFIDNSELLLPDKIYRLVAEYQLEHDIKERSCVLFIDECQILFNARSWNADGRSDWNKFFTLHRKLGFDIYLICQFDEMLDKQVRHLVEYQIVHRKLSNFGLGGLFLKLLTFGDVFIAVEYWYGIKEKTSQHFFKARKKYYRLYDTYNMFDFAIPEK